MLDNSSRGSRLFGGRGSALGLGAGLTLLSLGYFQLVPPPNSQDMDLGLSLRWVPTSLIASHTGVQLTNTKYLHWPRPHPQCYCSDPPGRAQLPRVGGDLTSTLPFLACIFDNTWLSLSLSSLVYSIGSLNLPVAGPRNGGSPLGFSFPCQITGKNHSRFPPLF